MKKENEEVFNNYKKLVQEAVEDLKTPGKRHKQIPNVLTTLRLLAPFAILPAAATGNLPLTIGLIVGFSLTDWVDGFIARKFKLTSELGKDLDAVTDKVFATTLLLAASFSNPLLITNLALEGVIAGINTHQKLSGMDASSSYIGKIKTWALFGLAGLGIVSSSVMVPGLLPTLAVGTAALQGLTIASYLSKYNNQPKDQSKEEKPVQQIVRKVIEEQQMPVLEKTKTKEIVDNAPTTITQETQQNLEDLRNMSEFLHQVQQAHSTNEAQTENAKVYQKTDSTNK